MFAEVAVIGNCIFSITSGIVLILNPTLFLGQNFEVGSVCFGCSIIVFGLLRKNFSDRCGGISANFCSMFQSFTISEKYLFGLRFLSWCNFSSISLSSALAPRPKLVSVGYAQICPF